VKEKHVRKNVETSSINTFCKERFDINRKHDCSALKDRMVQADHAWNGM
jgi:hypothetical protein